jgi:hypothetical protein
MSTLDRPGPKTLPPLVAGQRLDRATFHERYEAMPPDTRAELVGGVVYMPSPLGYDHGEWEGNLSDWLGYYKRFTRGVQKAHNVSTFFDNYGEVQPDIQLRIPEGLGGQSRIEGIYVVGAPELVAEVAKTSLPHDLGEKKADYERAGVREYLVIGLDPQEVHWFVLRDGRFADLQSGPDGVFRSEVFPGLWLDPRAFFAEDTDELFAVLDRGLATPEHAEFVERLARRAGGA